MIRTFKKNASWAIAALMLAAALAAWFRPGPGPQTEYLTVEKEKIVERIRRVTVPVEKIVVVEKMVVVEKLGLPDWVKQDADTQVLAAGIVGPYRGETSVVSLLNTKTGEGSIIQKRRPLPFTEFLDDKEVGVLYGAGFAAWGRWTFARVGAFHATAGAVMTAADGVTTSAAGIGLAYRW